MNCHRYIKCFCLRLAVLICIAGIASFSALGQRYPFHNLNVDDGLIQSQARCLAQDRTGNLWIGTLGGISRYDGKTFTNYNVRNGLLDNMVEALAADSSGNIWIGSREGLSMFNGKAYKHFSMTKMAEHSRTNMHQIFVVGDTIWWRAGAEVYYVTGGKIKYMVTPGPVAPVTSILSEHGTLWIAKNGQLYRETNNVWDSLKFELPTDQKPPLVYKIFRDKDKEIWVTTATGLFKVVGNKVVQFEINGIKLNYPAMLSITQDNSGAIWLGTNTGVIKISGNTLQNYNKHNGLSDNTFSGLLTDAEGSVWMASDGQGVFRFSGTQFTGLDETMGLPSAQIMAIASNKRDSLFLGTYDAGLFVFKDGKISARQFPEGPVPTITSLCYAHNQKLWIGTRNRGLWSYDHTTFRQFSAPERGFMSNYITTIYEDPTQRLWIGFENGAIVHSGDSFKVVTTPDQNLFVESFLSIGNDSVLMATDKGMHLYSGGMVSSFKTNTIVDSSQVHCFILKGRDIWMGCSDNGVIRYNMDTKKCVVIDKSNGLRSDFIYNIIADNDGNIWVGTGFGIHRITVKLDEEPQVMFYGKSQGITGMESNSNAVIKMPDGGIWFGTTNGALHYQPHSSVVSSVPTGIVLQSVKLAGEGNIESSYYDSTDNWYGIPYHLSLPYRKNNITFTYQAITLNGAEQVLYRYKMDGIDAPWSEWSANNSVTYSALPPGRYTFHAQCIGNGAGLQPELTYSFEIITPFQKTGWFRLVVLIACILTGILLQYVYNHRRQRRNRLRAKLRAEEQAKIRLRTAEDFHDEIGNKLTRINVLTNVLKSKITPTPDVTRILGQIEENTGLLYGGTRDILCSLKPTNDNLYEILLRIREFGEDLFQDTNVNFIFTGTSERWRNYRLQMDMSRNLLMIFKEALNNTLKYSKAQNVTMEVSLKSKDVLQILLKDDGMGFDPKSVTRGNGINNMQVRAQRLNGRLYLDSTIGRGTIISLTFKIPRNR